MNHVVFFDFDSTLNIKESFDAVIHYAFSKHPDNTEMIHEIERITALGMEGKLAFTESLERRFKALPLTKNDFDHVGMELVNFITPGMPEIIDWLATHSIPVYVVSGGFYECVHPSATRLQIPETHVFTNHMRYDGAGNAIEIDKTSLLYTDHGKAPVVNEVMKKYKDTQALLIGDGMNDYRAYMEGAVQHFIGFGGNVSRNVVREHAPHFAKDTGHLFALLKEIIA